MSVLQPRSPKVVILEEPGGLGLLLQGKRISCPGRPARDQEKQGTNLWSRYQRICNLPALLSFHILSHHSRRREETPLPRALERDCACLHLQELASMQRSVHGRWALMEGSMQILSGEEAKDSSCVPFLPSFLSGRRWGAEMPKQFLQGLASKTQRQFKKKTLN